MLQRGALEKEANRKVSAQRDCEVSRWYPIRSFLNLSNDAGPSSQRQQLGRQIVDPLRLGDTELSEGIGYRAECVAPGRSLLDDESRER